MNLIYKSAIIVLLLLFTFTNSYAGTKGRFVGKIDGNAIDVEVMCDIDDNRPNSFGIRSEEGMDSEKDKK